MAAFEADSKEGDEAEAYKEDSKHEYPAPVGVNPKVCQLLLCALNMM